MIDDEKWGREIDRARVRVTEGWETPKAEPGGCG
jgi:hypothetical protein